MIDTIIMRDPFIMENIFTDMRKMIEANKEWWKNASEEEKAKAGINKPILGCD